MSCYYPPFFTNKFFRKHPVTNSYKEFQTTDKDWKTWGKNNTVHSDHLNPASKDVTIIGQPIEITHLDNFKVDITFPNDFIASIDKHILDEFLNGGIKRAQPKRCNCASTDLFRHGCQCGGK